MAISATLKVEDVKVLARSTKAVSDAANRVDQRVGLLIVDLATQPADIDVDDVGGRIEMQVPDVLQQHGAGDDAGLVAHQIFQKLELFWQQLDLLAVTAGGARNQVDRQIPDAQNGFLGDGVAAPAERLEPRQKLHEGKRL